GVLLGAGGIIWGDSTGYEWLEFPPYASVVLFISYSLVVSWAMLMFRFRRGDNIYITQWYLLGAFLWFPWVYGATQVMLFVVPVQGVMQAAVTWWLAIILIFLWFGAIALVYSFFTMTIFGSMYYIVPRLVGREWRYATLIKLHFWASAYGVGLMVAMLLIGGIAQGSSLGDPSVGFANSTDSILPYLRGRSVS